MEYEKETLLEMDFLAIKEFKAKKTLWERSNLLFEKFTYVGRTIRLGLSSCLALGMFFCLDSMGKSEGFTTTDMLWSGIYFLGMFVMAFMGKVTDKVVDSKSWIYRYIKPHKELLEMDSLREEWNQTLADFSPLLQDEHVQFQILKNLNTQSDCVCVSFKPEYERLIGWLKHYLKYKEYQQAAITLLSIYELLEKQSDNAKDGDYYNELNKKFTVPGYQAKL